MIILLKVDKFREVQIMRNKCSVLVVAILVSSLFNYTSIAEDRILIKEHTLRGQEYVP